MNDALIRYLIDYQEQIQQKCDEIQLELYVLKDLDLNLEITIKELRNNNYSLEQVSKDILNTNK